MFKKQLKPNTLGDYLDRTTHLFHDFNEKQARLLALNAKVKPIFKSVASMDVSVAYADDTVLTLSVENQTAINHLRYLTSLFLPELKRITELQSLERVEYITIQTKQNTVQTELKPTHNISDKARSELEKTAGMIRDNPSLSHALHQLANKK